MGKLRYDEKDFVKVFDADGVELPAVPRDWIGTRLLPPGVSTEKSDEDDGSYSKMTNDQLKAEITSRNEGREDDDKLSTEGKKADLIATLEADDLR